jgi:hypothetical protein
MKRHPPYRKAVVLPRAPRTFSLLPLLFLLAARAACSGPPGGGGPPGPGEEISAGGFAGGSGTAADPWRVRTGAQLAYLAGEVNNGTDFAGEYVTLTDTLDLGGREWTAIGTPAHPFRGVFDGNAHIIYNLFINKPDAGYQGLFGYLDGATIRKLCLEHVTVTGKDCVGGVAGFVINSGIENSYSTGNVSGDHFVGGVAGSVNNSGIENSYSTGNVSGNSSVGGGAGYVFGAGGGSGSIENSYSTGTVSGAIFVGGVAGRVSSNTGGSSSIENSYSTGTVSGDIWVGGVAGIVGSIDGSDNIENSYSTGTVSGGIWVGGIAGYVGGSGGSASIVHCAALNPRVTATTSGAGRVVGFISGNAFTGNVAWDGMESGDGIEDGAAFDTNPDAGTGVTTLAVKDGSGLPAALKSAPWVYAAGKLPILSGLTGQNDALPPHLQSKLDP